MCMQKMWGCSLRCIKIECGCDSEFLLNDICFFTHTKITYFLYQSMAENAHTIERIPIHKCAWGDSVTHTSIRNSTTVLSFDHLCFVCFSWFLLVTFGFFAHSYWICWWIVAVHALGQLQHFNTYKLIKLDEKCFFCILLYHFKLEQRYAYIQYISAKEHKPNRFMEICHVIKRVLNF